MSVIGIDLDGTLADSAEWFGGDVVSAPAPHMVELMRKLHEAGHLICIWTCRADYVADKWLAQHGLREYVHAINRSPYPTESGKASFDFYIGDEAIRWDGDAGSILDLISNSSKGKKASDFDRDSFFSSHNPVPYLSGVGKAYVDMFETHWREAWQKHERKGKSIAFLTICSHAKPYSKSYIHTSVRAALHSGGYLAACDYIHISNAGIIPASAEMVYPFNAYDWNGEYCTPEVREYHVQTIERRLADWLQEHGGSYRRIVFYLRGNGNTCGAVRNVLSCNPLPNAVLVEADAGEEHYPQFVHERDVDDCLTSHANLRNLISKLRGN
jgi:hypothetical protein